MEFKFVYQKEEIQDQEQLLQQLVSILEKQNSTKLAKSLTEYIQQRLEYIKNYKGQYVQISDDDIKPLDITEIDNKDLGFNSKYKGILIKVGNEVQKSTNTLVAWSYRPPTTSPTYDIIISNQNNNTHIHSLLDTGCQITTFSDQVLAWAKRMNPDYAITPTLTTGIGGTVVVQQGTMDISFCNRMYTKLVNYTPLQGLPYAGLIGMDIFNSGVLTLATGTTGSFTFY